MIKSIIRYFKYFSITLLKKEERKILFRDLKWYLGLRKINFSDYEIVQKSNALHSSANWLFKNQNFSNDYGFSTYRIIEGHTSSYPETSGYIIDSLLNYTLKYNKDENISQLIKCADWLISIQKQSGGWQSGYVNENKSEVVFNTGQVMRGLLRVYKFTSEKKYLNSCIKAGDWLCMVQEYDGSWKKFAFMNVARVYETYVSAPLLLLWQITNEEKYKIAAEKNIQWVIKTKIKANGWFEDCDNTIKHNSRPILHTIAYTLDGLIECANILSNKDLVKNVMLGADEILKIFVSNNYLWGRYDDQWNPSESFICTGGAQISIVWLKLYEISGDKKYLDGAKKMNSFLCAIQSETLNMDIKINGALQGSFPIWGRYEPFAFPNWATKYLLDALMLEEDLNK